MTERVQVTVEVTFVIKFEMTKADEQTMLRKAKKEARAQAEGLVARSGDDVRVKFVEIREEDIEVE